MTKEQIEQLEEFAFELRNNRDCYSRAKIIEMMVDEVKKLNKPAVSKCEDVERKLQLAIDGLKGALRTGAMNRARFITNVLDEIEAIDNCC